MITENKLLSTPGLARRLDTTPETVRKYIRAGVIEPDATVNGRLAFFESRLAEIGQLIHRTPRTVSLSPQMPAIC